MRRDAQHIKQVDEIKWLENQLRYKKGAYPTKALENPGLSFTLMRELAIIQSLLKKARTGFAEAQSKMF